MNMEINTTTSLKVPKQAQFYCLIAKKSGINAHTFFHMGFVNDQNQSQPLLEIGKVLDGGLRYNDQFLGVLTNALFSQTGALIRNENNLLLKDCYIDIKHDINYSAYSVTKVQYLYFLGLLKQVDAEQRQLFQKNIDKIIAKEIQYGYVSNETLSIQKCQQKLLRQLYRRNFIKAFMPVDNDGNYQYQEIAQWQNQTETLELNLKQQHNKLIHDAQHLSLTNNCRHTGLDFLNAIFNNDFDKYNQNVSKCFLSAMPCLTSMQAGKYNSQLYLLPLPPISYQLDKNQYKILAKVYKRMERLLQHNYHHPNTRKKFDLLNKAYLEMVGSQNSEINFLQIIVNYSRQQSAKNIIDQHRGLHWPFFHSTKTKEMFNDFENQLQRNIRTNS